MTSRPHNQFDAFNLASHREAVCSTHASEPRNQKHLIVSLYKQSLKKVYSRAWLHFIKFIQPFSMLSYISRWKEPQWGVFCLFYVDAVLWTVIEIVPNATVSFWRIFKLKFHMATLAPVCDVQVVLEPPFFLGCGFTSYMHAAHDNKKHKFTVLKIKCVHVKMKPINFLNNRRRERRHVWSPAQLSGHWSPRHAASLGDLTPTELHDSPQRCCWVFCTG